MKRYRLRAAMLLMTLGTSLALAQPVQVPKPGARDLCPVCGMVVSKYPEWTASVVFRDGHVHHFDGAKDLFKYLHQMSKYAPGHPRADIARIAVTEFYDLQRIDASTAWYVIGSNVTGPMGHEFVPLASREDAVEFMRDHAGRRLLRFEEIGAALPARLDAGRFDD